MRMMYQPNQPLASQSETIVINQPVNIVYRAVRNAVMDGKKYKMADENSMLYRVSFKTKASLLSWGELVTVQLEDRGQQTALTISAQPKTTLGSQAVGAQAMTGKQIKKEIDQFFKDLSAQLPR